MRSYLSLFLLAAMLPTTGAAQVYQWPTPPPRVTATDASWRRTGEPIYYAGSIYDPSGPTEFFDGQIMARIGIIDGVPVYENKTLEPWSVVLVPLTGKLMQPYERRRAGPLVGTVGSRMPGRPIQRHVELSMANDSAHEGEVWRGSGSGRAEWTWPTPPAPADSAPPLAPLARQTTTAPSSVPVIRTIPQRETTNAGAYVDFGGTHYYSSGKAVPHDEPRFTRVGDIGGAAAFREVGGSENTIHVEVVPGGLLAPYTRR